MKLVRFIKGKATRKDKLFLAMKVIGGVFSSSGGLLLIGAIFLVIIAGGGAGSQSGGNMGGGGAIGNKDLSEATLSFKGMVETECAKQGVPDLVPYVLAIIQVESGGDVEASGGDIMQSSESVDPNHPGLITSPEKSVEAGVKHLAGNFNSTKQFGQDIWAAIASYNFGGEYNTVWMAQKNETKWTYDSAESYSAYKSGGKKVDYKNAVSVPINGGWKYYYGNQFYPLLIKQFITEGATGGGGTYSLPVDNPIITSPYGQRPATPVSPPQFHKGIDFGNPYGTEIKAAMDGTVVIAQQDGVPVSGYGIATVIQHDNGQWTLYAHQSEQFVKVGDTVKQGQVIGKLGSTGQSSGPHLHFEVRTSQNGGEGNVVDPAPLLGL